jgi:hypothetical protein
LQAEAACLSGVRPDGGETRALGTASRRRRRRPSNRHAPGRACRPPPRARAGRCGRTSAVPVGASASACCWRIRYEDGVLGTAAAQPGSGSDRGCNADDRRTTCAVPGIPRLGARAAKRNGGVRRSSCRACPRRSRRTGHRRRSGRGLRDHDHSARVKRRPIGIDRLGGINPMQRTKKTRSANAGVTPCLATVLDVRMPGARQRHGAPRWPAHSRRSYKVHALDSLSGKCWVSRTTRRCSAPRSPRCARRSRARPRPRVGAVPA